MLTNQKIVNETRVTNMNKLVTLVSRHSKQYIACITPW